MNARAFIAFCLTFLTAAKLSAQTAAPLPPDDIYLHIKIVGANRDNRPEVWQNYFLLAYHDDYRRSNFVGVAFEHENYATVHSFVRNKNNTFVYYAKLPETDMVRYRLIVDGIWQADPKNDSYIIDQRGIKISQLAMPLRERSYIGPQLNQDGSVDFYLNAQPGAQVFLTGDFSRWDPFMYPMAEIKEGLYKTTVFLKPGQCYYSFLYNGQRLTDPGNFRQAIVRATGETVSVMDVPAGTS